MPDSKDKQNGGSSYKPPTIPIYKPKPPTKDQSKKKVEKEESKDSGKSEDKSKFEKSSKQENNDDLECVANSEQETESIIQDQP